jgi:hypothetical protein
MALRALDHQGISMNADGPKPRIDIITRLGFASALGWLWWRF